MVGTVEDREKHRFFDRSVFFLVRVSKLLLNEP
jgi:hypothetical protein